MDELTAESLIEYLLYTIAIATHEQAHFICMHMQNVYCELEGLQSSFSVQHMCTVRLCHVMYNFLCD